MFRSTQNKGFQITFENNITISVQFGKGNYCSNRNSENSMLTTDCKDAEIAIWQGDNWFDFEADTVKGYVSPSEVAEWIAKIQKVQYIYQLSNK